MKLFFITLTSAYVILRIIFTFLDKKGGKTPAKEELALKYFTEDDIKKAKEYHDRGFGASIARKIISFIFPLAFFFSGFSMFLSNLISPLSFGYLTLQAILFILCYFVLEFLINLPFSYYFSFSLEHKFGFSNMTLKEWLIYTLKQFSVGAVINMVIISAAYITLRKAGANWIWFIPVVLLAFELIFTFLYPYIILPLFYKKSNFEQGEYTAPIFEVAKRSGIKLKKLFQINESKYSKHTNAFFTGFGPEKSIYIFDTLVKNNTPEEVASVVAHEAGHWKHHHVLKGIALGFFGSFVIAYLISLTFFEFANGLNISNIAGLPLLSFILTIFTFFTTPIDSFISRKMEVTADTYELRSTGKREVFISSMVRLAKDNKSYLYTDDFLTFWFASHPPMLERIKMAIEFDFGKTTDTLENK